MSIKINRFEVKQLAYGKSTANIIDHYYDEIIATVNFHSTYRENKELAENIIPIIEAEIEEE